MQSRDNAIRLLDYGSSRGTIIKKRFFGAKCSNQKVQCTISTDGQFLVAGSETGMPYIWQETTEMALDNREYECRFADVVSDVDWNPRYNMFALCGFGQEFPILVYVYERTETEIEDMQYRFQGQLTSAVEEETQYDDP